MNIERNISSTRITWIVGLLLGLGLAVMVGSAVGAQNYQRVALIVGAGIGIGSFLALGKNYWLLIPFSLGAAFPAVPLGGRSLQFPELCIAGCALFFILRVATRKEKFRLFAPVNTPFLLFMAWVGMIFVIHPIGFSMLGASVGGGRFYVKLALAFASFIILSNRTYTEREIKWVLGIMVFGAFFSACYGIAEYFMGWGQQPDVSGYAPEEFYTWHQVLSMPAMTLTFLIFSRWSPAQVFGFQRPWVLLLFLLSLLLVVLSGKRMALAAVMVAPLLSALMFRQYKYVVIAAVLSSAMVFALVAGQGSWFNLPLVAQRTFSWLPGQWDPELDSMRGGMDDFRKELRRLAAENIKADPIIGQGYAMNIGEILGTMTLQQQDGNIDIVTAGHAISRNWHNLWLGYAADFGIPLSVIQAFIFVSLLVLSSKVFRCYRNSNFFGVFALYVFIFTCRDLMASHTGGHTAIDAFDRWWMYGILVAIYLQMKIAGQSSGQAYHPGEQHRGAGTLEQTGASVS